MQIPFGNNQAFLTSDSDIWKQFQKKFYTEYHYNTDYRYNVIKDVAQISISELQKNQNRQEKFISTVNFGGIKVLLYLTRMDGINVCIYMDRLKRKMYITNYRFEDEVFNGTLFTGELIQRNDNKHLFVIEDLVVHNNTNILKTHNIIQRLGIVKEILDTKYTEDINLDTYYFSIKNIYLYDKPEELVKYYTNCKEIVNSVIGYIYFPSISYYMGISYYFLNLENEEEDEKEKLYDTDKEFCFSIKDSGHPEIYHLYLKNQKNAIGIARLPTLESSRFINELVYGQEKDIYVMCRFDKNFQKWIPFKHCEDRIEADDYSLVNSSMIEIN